MPLTEILCRKCGRKLGIVQPDGTLQVLNGHKELRVRGNWIVAFDCDRCGSTTDLASPLNVSREHVVRIDSSMQIKG